MDNDVWERALRIVLFGAIGLGLIILTIGVAVGLALS